MYVEPYETANIFRNGMKDRMIAANYFETLLEKMEEEQGKLLLQQRKETIAANDTLAKVRGTNGHFSLHEVRCHQLCEEKQVTLVQDSSRPCRMESLREAFR